MAISGGARRKRVGRVVVTGLAALMTALSARCADVDVGLGAACIRNTDCASGLCEGRVCVAPAMTFDGGDTATTLADATVDASDGAGDVGGPPMKDSGPRPPDGSTDARVDHEAGDARSDASDVGAPDGQSHDGSEDVDAASDGAASDAKQDAAVACATSATCIGGTSCLGGVCLPPTVLLFGGSSTSLLTGTWSSGGSWETSTLAGATSYGTSLTVESNGMGVGVFTSATGSLVDATVWKGGAWSTPAPVSATAAAMSQPFIDATGGTTAHLLYQDSTFHYWYLAYAADAWTLTPLSVGNNYGPEPATIAALGSNATAAFIDGQSSPANELAQEDITGGSWQFRADLTTVAESFTIAPVIIPLSAGPELMAVFVQQDSQVMFMTRSMGVWSAPAEITHALTNDRVGLAPLPGGGAMMPFRGTDGNLYWSLYTAGSPGTWSSAIAVATPLLATDTSPAVTHGIGGDVAELAYVSSGVAYHARFSGGAWLVPVMVGGSGLHGVSIAAAP